MRVNIRAPSRLSQEERACVRRTRQQQPPDERVYHSLKPLLHIEVWISHPRHPRNPRLNLFPFSRLHCGQYRTNVPIFASIPRYPIPANARKPAAKKPPNSRALPPAISGTRNTQHD